MRIARALLAFALLAAALAVAPRLTPLPRWIREVPAGSIVLLDRAGGRLAEVNRPTDPAGAAAGRPIPLERIDPLLIRATLAAEDRRFFRHPGVDPLALARALREGLLRGRAVRGASTITMQVVRISRGQPRGFFSRLGEVWWSLVLESHLAKKEILGIYLNRAPYGPSLRGVAAGAQRWFGRPPEVLSPAEAALLAAIPRAPGRLDPARHPGASRAARDMVLRRMKRCGWLTEGEAARATASPLDLVPPASRETPHFNAWVRNSIDPLGLPPAIVTTTLDPATQRLAEKTLRERLESLGERVRGGAVIVLDTGDAAVRAMVGSRSFDSPDAGQVNAALSPRQPGSAVKPFTYAVAFAGSIRPSTILADVPTSYEDPTGVFAPRNYAGGFAGPVPARLALANSWNVPTVEVLERTGFAEVAKGYEAVGLAREEDVSRLGLGLTLGAGEVTLLDLAAAYATLARGGTWMPPRGISEARGRDGRLITRWNDADRGSRIGSNPIRAAQARDGRILAEAAGRSDEQEMRRALDPVSCAWVNAILSDPSARSVAFGRGGPLEIDGPVAAKTGTSSDWRDAWAVLYTTRHTVAVWMGNPDGTPTDQVTGVQGPALVARTIMESLEEREPSGPFAIPDGIEQRAVCPLSGCAAGADCPQVDWASFRRGDPPLSPCPVHVARRIDVETGLLARGCTPTSRVREAIFVQLPERFAYWQADRGLPRPPDAATECLCGSASCCPLDSPQGAVVPEEPGIAILRPVDGTVIAWDPTLAQGQQMLSLEVAAPPGAVVEWLVDGTSLGETSGPRRIFWPVRLGEHRITARLSRCGDGRPLTDHGIRAVSTVRVLGS